MRPRRALSIYIALLFFGDFAIGLRGGWIFWLKSHGTLTIGVPGSDTWLVGTGKMIDGWLGLAVLARALAAFTRPPAMWITGAVT